MIHHLSIAVNDPEHVASVLTELMGGYYRKFPIADNCFMAFQLDAHGTQVEIYPAGTYMKPSQEGPPLTMAPPRTPAYGATHFALSVDRSEDEVHEIMARAGWICRRNDRAEFPVVEVWIENEQMFEVLTPEFAQKYLEVTAETKRQVDEARADGVPVPEGA